MDGYFSDVAPSSAKLYKANLMRLNDGKMPKTIAFLKRTDVIKDKLMAMKVNTRKTYIIPIMKIFKDHRVKKYYAFYAKMLDDLDTEKPPSKVKTLKEEEKWVSDELIEKTEKRLKDDPKRLMEYLLFSLYTKIPPRRAMDFMEVHISAPQDEFSKNYYHDKRFYFRSYKTAKCYGEQIVEVPDELDEIIQKWLLVNDTGLLLPKWTAPRNTRVLNKIFGAGISVNMIRKAYATKQHAQSQLDLQATASAMGNSPGTLVKDYIKYDAV
jgi:hypothetical protein